MAPSQLHILLTVHNSVEHRSHHYLHYKVVSSAYISIIKMLLTRGKSFIYIRNNKGPKTDLGKTPVGIGNSVDISPLIN